MDEKTLNMHFLVLVTRTGIVFDGFSDLRALHPQDYEEMIEYLRANTALLLTSSDSRVREIATFLVNKRKLLEHHNA
jgi:hypothetical protein